MFFFPILFKPYLHSRKINISIKKMHQRNSPSKKKKKKKIDYNWREGNKIDYIYDLFNFPTTLSKDLSIKIQGFQTRTGPGD